MTSLQAYCVSDGNYEGFIQFNAQWDQRTEYIPQRTGNITIESVDPYHSVGEEISTLITDYTKWVDLIHLSAELEQITHPIESILDQYISENIIYYRFPEELRDLFISIADSYWIAGLEDNWDEVGSKGCSLAVWLRAKELIRNYSIVMWDLLGKTINPMQISPDLEGGVDIYWEVGPYGLLINVPDSEDDPITYYGDNADYPGRNIVQGDLQDTIKVDVGVLAWLAYLS